MRKKIFLFSLFTIFLLFTSSAEAATFSTLCESGKTYQVEVRDLTSSTVLQDYTSTGITYSDNICFYTISVTDGHHIFLRWKNTTDDIFWAYDDIEAYHAPVVLATSQPNYAPLLASGYTVPPTVAEIRQEIVTNAGLATASSVTALGSPMQADVYTAPDNAGIATIQGQTDRLTFNNEDKVISDASVDIEAIIEGINAGLTGSQQITATVYVADTTVPISGYVLSIYNSSNTVFLGKVMTDTMGLAVFNLDPGTYKIRGIKTGYTALNASETLVVSVDSSATYYANAYSISAPVAANACRIFEWAFMPDDVTPMTTVVATATIETLPYDYNGKLHAGSEISAIYDSSIGLLYWDIVYGATVRFVIEDLYKNPVKKTIPAVSTKRLSTL